MIDSWVGIINENEQINTELLNAYENYISNINVNQQFNYQSLLQFCTSVEGLRRSYNDVSKYNRLIETIKSLDVDSEPQDEANYKNRIDTILMNLISNYDAEELELKNQQEYYRLIIENNSDIEQAQAQYDAFLDLQNEHFNIGKQMLKWAIYDDSQQTDVQVRKFGFQNTKKWFITSLNNWDAKLKSAFPNEYKLHIDSWMVLATVMIRPNKSKI